MAQPEKHVDVLVIGGGVVGSSILRELMRFNAHCVLLDARPDVCDGTSKANSSIVHCGFDAPPGTLEAALIAESRSLWSPLAEELGFAYHRIGAVLVATDDQELRTVRSDIAAKARKNDVEPVDLSAGDIRDILPGVTERVLGGLLIEDEGVCDPFRHTVTLGRNAVANGAEIHLNQHVVALEHGTNAITVRTAAGMRYRAGIVVNAAGLWADDIARLAGDVSFTIAPRKGQFLISDDPLRIDHIVLPVPNSISKGILITPAVFGGTVMGPTAEEQRSKTDTATTETGLRQVREGAARLIPAVGKAGTVHQYAGLRPVSSTGGYIIGPSSVNRRLFHAAGIRSTGLTASPAIGRYVAEMVAGELALSRNNSFDPSAGRVPDPEPGQSKVVCLCRAVTRGEVMSWLNGPLGPQTIDGLKRRTGVTLGPCQGNICIPDLIDLIADSLGSEPIRIDKDLPGSNPAIARTPAVQRA